MQRIFILAFVAVTVGVVTAQKISGGGCPDVPVKQNFDVNKYVGVWYEIEKYPMPFESGLKCITANYTAKDDYVVVVNAGISERTGKVQSIEGKATIPDKNVPSKLKVKFNYMPFKSNYWVLDTDYDEYSVVYSCFSVLHLFKTEFVWILSRESALEEATRENIYKFLDDNKIDRKALTATVQNC
ncbi:apolipoprotein D [Parasteatoda tepidariorum]|uniref:apolipoprotein D n=1 Tax=Parasteatoda tepidariorum TaxID=114398 RepID=UPI001C71FC73|nr:apolipoprotein D [Parasteatoda tepidariorum]